MPNQRTIETLTEIWHRVLQRSPIAPGDNFFDLNGDPLLANQLFAEIAKQFDRELSPLTIYQAPTIAALAAVLEEPDLPRFPAVLKLKAGTEMPPVFMIHGLCSSVMEFFELVKHIDSLRPIYGVQARGLDGVDEPYERLEDLAEFYLNAIRSVQPHGPYTFVGYSFGGLVAMEMAQRLSASGEKTALLVMVETYPYRSHVPLGQFIGISVRRAKRRFAKALRRAGLLSPAPIDLGEKEPYSPKAGKKFTAVMRSVCVKGFLAFERYRPQRYKGRINFIRATTSLHILPANPHAVWDRLADEFLVETAPGGHWGIVTTQYKALAGILSRYLKLSAGG
jgi:acetoacetyl-CoA synthetase